MKRIAAIVCLALTAAQSPTAPSTEYSWQCEFTQRTVCSGQSCTPSKAKTWIFLSPDYKVYDRCEGKGFDNCDHYQPVVSASGAYRLFELPGRGAFAKVGPALEVTEVLTLQNTVFVNRGKCISAPPPLVRLQR